MDQKYRERKSFNIACVFITFSQEAVLSATLLTWIKKHFEKYFVHQYLKTIE